jgi:Na+/phosphate symporter
MVALLGQVPLVGIFVWFTLLIYKYNQEAQDKRDNEWRDFLREQREASNLALGRLAEEIKGVTVITSNVLAILTAHDTRVQSAVPTMQEAVEEIKSSRERKTRPRT